MTNNFPEERYRNFSRQQALYTPPLQKSEPIRSWLADALGFAGVVFLCVLANIAVHVLIHKTDSARHNHHTTHAALITKSPA